jgi:hypothetical protein
MVRSYTYLFLSLVAQLKDSHAQLYRCPSVEVGVGYVVSYKW